MRGMSKKPTGLASLFDWRDEITLVPFSGIQILDFGFCLDALDMRAAQFIERITSETDETVERALLSLTGDDEADAPLLSGAREDDDPYAIRPVAALEPFLAKWVPVPVLRRRNERGPGGEERFDPGPSSWARLRTVELDQPDPATGHTHRVQLALDTTLAAENAGSYYITPERMDAEKSREFSFVADPARMDWFLRRPEADGDGNMLDPQQWVSDWIDDLFMAFRRAERPGRRITRGMLPHQFEHWARYLTYLKVIDTAVRIPRMRFVNTVSSRESVTPVDVDLVLDIGNSRTCGILIERFPGDARVDLTRSFPLEIRDLSRPEFNHTGLFESRVEFADLRLGDERHGSRSGRRNAFIWPTFVRIGPEALRMIASEQGTETTSGLSSPKRYIWDNAPTQQDWRFHDHSDPNNLPRSVRSAMRHLNEAGDVLEQIADEERRQLRLRGRTPATPAMRPRFSRSSLFGFMLAEVFAHALVQVNAPASRGRRLQSELPRRLDRIILTLPTATSAQEQAIIRSRAEGALALLWAQMGITETDSAIARRPELIVEWDEASCTQLVYLYSEVIQKFDGHIERFLDLKGRPRPARPGAPPTPSLRLACIDVGGGTTDLMITTYRSEANRVLHPVQTFREGFRVAGDELLQRVIAAVILPELRRAIEGAGGRFVDEKLREMFAGDLGGQDQRLVQKRRQFALRVLMPLAVAVQRACEGPDDDGLVTVPVAETLSMTQPAETEVPTNGADRSGMPAPGVPDPTVPDELVQFIEDAARSLGAEGFRLAEVVLTCSREDVDAIAREVFQRALSNMVEVIDHVGADIVLLTGRPSRLPAVRSVIEEMLVVPPDRLISMHAYRTGNWYPFRDPVTQRIGDPKSTVAVGGMLIALSEGQIANFKVATEAFRMKSTARFIGEMDTSGKIGDDRLLFADVDLDQRKSDRDQRASLKMYTMLHLGARQLPLERWMTTPLYRLDYASPSAQRRKPPLTVTFERADHEDDDEKVTADSALRREALREAFTITEVEDADGDPMKPADLRLRLHTLGLDDEYWIDTGLFRI
jgi:hypothetical protein